MEFPIVRNIVLTSVLLLLSGCVAEQSSRVLATPEVVSATKAYYGPRSSIAVGKFDNRSAYLRGIFTNNVNQLGNQAKTILVTHLQKSGRFNVFSRDNMPELGQEAKYRKQEQNIKGAAYILTGDVTAFGRKQIGDKQLFGLLGRGKSQIAYATVSLNLLNVNTSEVVYSSQGAGEYTLSSREIIGTGSTASYDSTLNGKVLDLAIREAVDKLVEGMESGAWTPVQ